MAGVTQRLRVGTSVGCVYYRNPLLIARAAADVDRISDGRLVLGLGIGHREDEFATMGVPYPPVAERQRALSSAIDAIWGLWGDVPVSTQGGYFHVAGANVRPVPVQKPMSRC